MCEQTKGLEMKLKPCKSITEQGKVNTESAPLMPAVSFLTSAPSGVCAAHFAVVNGEGIA